MSKSIKTGEKFVHNSFFMVRFKTKEGAIPFGHTLDTTRPCILFKLGLYTNISIEQDSIWLSKISNLVGHVVKQCEARSMRNGIRNIYIILIRLLKSRLQLTLQLFFFYGFLLLTLDHVRNIYMAMLKSRLGLIQLKIYRNQRFCYFIDS